MYQAQKAIKDLTPDTQAKFDTRKSKHKHPKTRYEKAGTRLTLITRSTQIATSLQAKSGELSQAEKKMIKLQNLILQEQFLLRTMLLKRIRTS